MLPGGTRMHNPHDLEHFLGWICTAPILHNLSQQQVMKYYAVHDLQVDNDLSLSEVCMTVVFI